MPLSADDAAVVWNHRPPNALADGTQWTEGTYLQNIHVQITSLVGAIADLKTELDAVKAQIAALPAPTSGGTVDPVALAQAIAAHVKLAAQ